MQGTYTLPLTLRRGIVEDYRLLEQDRRSLKGKAGEYLSCLVLTLSDLGAGFPVHSLFVDSVGGIGACSMGVASVPPYTEEQVEWYSRGGRSDEVRIIVDRKVRTFRGSFVEPC